MAGRTGKSAKSSKGREELVILKQKVAAAEMRLMAYKAHAQHLIQEHTEAAEGARATANALRNNMTKVLSRLEQMGMMDNDQRVQAEGILKDYRVSLGHEQISESMTTMFTQQHYQAMAELLKLQKKKIMELPYNDPVAQELKLEGLAEFQLSMQQMFAGDNKKFKELLFIGAAGYVPPEPK